MLRLSPLMGTTCTKYMNHKRHESSLLSQTFYCSNRSFTENRDTSNLHNPSLLHNNLHRHPQHLQDRIRSADNTEAKRWPVFNQQLYFPCTVIKPFPATDTPSVWEQSCPREHKPFQRDHDF